MKKISVIIPIYNTEEFLIECFDSIVNQTMDLKEIQVIMINDGSTDNSKAICIEYQKKYGWDLILKENGGISIARNMGLDIAKGDYIYFLDSDDYIEKTAFENMYKIGIENNSDIVIAKNKIFYGEKQKNSYTEAYIKDFKTFDLLENKNIIRVVTVTNKLFKNKIIKNHRFLENVFHEDNYFMIIAYTKTKRITTVPNYYYFRRERLGENKSFMQKLDYQSFKHIIINFEKIIHDNKKKEMNKLLVSFTIKSLVWYLVREISCEYHKLGIKDILKYIEKIHEYGKINKTEKLYYNLFLFSYYKYKYLRNGVKK